MAELQPSPTAAPPDFSLFPLLSAHPPSPQHRPILPVPSIVASSWSPALPCPPHSQYRPVLPVPALPRPPRPQYRRVLLAPSIAPSSQSQHHPILLVPSIVPSSQSTASPHLPSPSVTSSSHSQHHPILPVLSITPSSQPQHRPGTDYFCCHLYLCSAILSFRLEATSGRSPWECRVPQPGETTPKRGRCPRPCC